MSRAADRERQAARAAAADERQEPDEDDGDATIEELRQLVAEDEAAYDKEVRDARALDQLDRLPVRQPGDATRGLWTDGNGAEHELISGRDEYTPRVDEVAEAKRIGPDPHMLGVAKHVETKFAMRMREHGLTDEVITVNNRPCPGELGCDETLPLSSRQIRPSRQIRR